MRENNVLMNSRIDVGVKRGGGVSNRLRKREGKERVLLYRYESESEEAHSSRHGSEWVIVKVRER